MRAKSIAVFAAFSCAWWMQLAPVGATLANDAPQVQVEKTTPVPDASQLDVEHTQPSLTDYDGSFTGMLEAPLDSHTARCGDMFSARLTSPLHIGKDCFAPGSLLTGHISEVDRPRCQLKAELSPKRWLRCDGGMKLEVDEVLGLDGAHACIHGTLSPMPRKFSKDVRETSPAVAKKGEIGPSRRTEIVPKLTRTAIGVTGTLLHSPLVPLAGGMLGAVAPSLVLESTDHDHQSEVKHRRLRGFAAGAIAGLPGGFLINDATLKGREAILPPGTILLFRLEETTTATPAQI